MIWRERGRERRGKKGKEGKGRKGRRGERQTDGERNGKVK